MLMRSSLISEKHAEYEKFVQRIEETPSWVCSDVPSGLEDLKSLILLCIPERYLEDCRKEVEENLKDPEFRRDCVDLYVEGMRREYDVHLDSLTIAATVAIHGKYSNTNTMKLNADGIEKSGFPVILSGCFSLS